MTHALELRIVFAMDNKRVACDRKKLRLACAQLFFGDRTLIILPLYVDWYLICIPFGWTCDSCLIKKCFCFTKNAFDGAIRYGWISSKQINEHSRVSIFDFYWSFSFLNGAIKYKHCDTKSDAKWYKRSLLQWHAYLMKHITHKGSLNFTTLNEVKLTLEL